MNGTATINSDENAKKEVGEWGEESEPVITATVCAIGERLEFLPKFFGRGYVLAESTLYRVMRWLCNEYDGGYWDYFTLDNGGFFMAPSDAGKTWAVGVDSNGWRGEMGSEAVGIVATLFTIGALAQKMAHTPKGASLADGYYALRDYAAQHAESRAIFGAID